MGSSLVLFALLAAASFDVASVKRSAEQKGADYRGRVLVSAGRVSGRNVTLQDMLAVAYRVQLSQVTGPRWIDSDEFDLDARGEGDLRANLQVLLMDRFHLVLARQTTEIRAQVLVVDKGGARLQAATGNEHFHGTMAQFADLLALQGTIPAPADPASPAISSREPLIVVDQTGLGEQIFDFAVQMKPEMELDRLTAWQRVLREQLGLRLESRRLMIERLVVKSAGRVPESN